MQAGMVKSAQRVFELLELFESECRPLRVGEIVQRLDMPQSSVSMLLKTLAARGYMDFDPQERTYCPSVRVAFLADWTNPEPEQAEIVRTVKARVAELRAKLAPG